MYSPETISRLEQLRYLEQSRGLTDDEAREVIMLIREGRVSAAASKPKTSAVKVDGGAILAKLQAALAASQPK